MFVLIQSPTFKENSYLFLIIVGVESVVDLFHFIFQAKTAFQHITFFILTANSCEVNFPHFYVPPRFLIHTHSHRGFDYGKSAYLTPTVCCIYTHAFVQGTLIRTQMSALLALFAFVLFHFMHFNIHALDSKFKLRRVHS